MKIIDDIKTNWSAKSSKIGVIFHKWVAGFLFLCSIIGGLNEVTQTFPTDLVPMWVKSLVFFATLISYVGGKLTKEQPKQ